MTKEEIWSFVDWIEKNRGVSLCNCFGYDEPSCLYDNEIEYLIKDYLIWNAEEGE